MKNTPRDHSISNHAASKNSWLWLYMTLFATWVSFCITIAIFFISSSLKDEQTHFLQYSDAYSEHLGDKVSSNKVVLEGFSALFSAFGNKNSQEVSRYARQVIENHPHIFSLEIVQAVPAENVNNFVLQRRKMGRHNYQIRNFGYNTDRQWHAAENQSVYYPIVFIAPLNPATEEVLGLDTGSVPFLRPALLESRQKKCAVSTPPFHLVEGNLAFVIFMPIQAMKHSADKRSKQESTYIVDMVVDTAKLTIPDNMPLPTNLHLVVYHSTFHPEDPAGQLVHVQQQAHSGLEQMLFPNFKFEKQIGPFLNIFAEKQIGWADINPLLLSMIVLASIISSAILLALIRSHHLGNIADMENKKNLWFMANHDILTRLPNRNLFMNRMEQAIARAQRQGKNLGILFLDLNGFKQINDLYGHDAGDLLLKLIASRLMECIRADDSVARLGGDEFVVLLEGSADEGVMESVAQKIRTKVSMPITINSRQFTISASIGKATFPLHGKTPDDLLKHADAEMYAEKKSGHPAGA